MTRKTNVPFLSYSPLVFHYLIKFLNLHTNQVTMELHHQHKRNDGFHTLSGGRSSFQKLAFCPISNKRQ